MLSSTGARRMHSLLMLGYPALVTPQIPVRGFLPRLDLPQLIQRRSLNADRVPVLQLGLEKRLRR